MHDDTDAFTVRLARAAESAAGDAAAAGARDIKIDGLSVSARGKTLLENTSFTIVAGRRYGLVGPNGASDGPNSLCTQNNAFCDALFADASPCAYRASETLLFSQARARARC